VGHVADAVGAASESRPAAADQRPQRIGPYDVLGAVCQVKLGEVPPHRKGTRVV
jgi:hypothetical protein